MQQSHVDREKSDTTASSRNLRRSSHVWPLFRLALVLAFLLAALPLFQPALANSNYSDDFNDPALNTSLWTFIDPLADSTLTMTGSQVSLTVPGGAAHYTGSGVNTAPRIMQASPNEDFEIEVKFDTAVGTYRLQGVRIESDLNNSLTVQFQHTGSGQTIAYINVVNGVASAPVTAAVPNGTPLYMRIQRQGNQWTLSHTKNLSSWTTAFQFERVMNVTSVGVLAGNLPATRVPAHTARVDYFYKRTAPFIEQHPANVTVTEPEAASFTVIASGTAPLTYQWRRDGVNIPGATSATYVLSPTSIADNGALFDVVVSNSYGSVTSQAATLTVDSGQPTPPSITQHPANVTVTEPESAAFTVEATGSDPLSYQWRRDGVNIPGATSAAYVLSPTSVADDGAQFDVIVSNAYGSVTSQPATLTVDAMPSDPPTISQHPANVTVTEPDAASFTVVAAGTDPLSYQWRRDGIAIPGATSPAYVLSPTSTTDSGAQFDVVVSNAYGSITSQPATLTVNPDTGGGTQELLPGNDSLIEYGIATAIDGDTLVIGSNKHVGSNTYAGAAYVFTRQGTSWQLQATLQPDVIRRNQFFGWSVAISGDTVIVGAPGDRSTGANAGAAYVFTRNGTTWTQQAKLVGVGTAAGDEMGISVAIDNNTAVVGSHLHDQMGSNAGTAYVFTRAGTTWSQQAEILPADLTANDGFGVDVSVDNDTLVVGSYNEGPNSAGAAYVFTRSGASWTQQSKLTAADAGAGQTFGFAVALHGDALVVGANGYGGSSFAGAAYVFQRNGGVWSQQQKLLPDASSNGLVGFGVSVAMDGSTILVGSHGDDQMADNAGAAYRFDWNGTTWAQQEKLVSPNPAAGQEFGVTVSVSGDTVVVGANSGKFNASMDGLTGSAYVFE